ncbi:MAG TPA: CsbD family protein [Terracidiphilus sp.]|nr:CsbD family protein [Terracidiphilus sp.]
MDKDRIKGTMDEIAGRVERQVGEWTGDTKAQIEGGLKELKGGARRAWGETKDAAREAEKAAERDASHENKSSS